MPSDPEHSIDALLGAYAEQRRKAAPGDPRMSPATRRALQEEVRRRFAVGAPGAERAGSRGGQGAWVAWVTGIWSALRRPAYAGAFVALLLVGLAVWLLLPAFRAGDGDGGIGPVALGKRSSPDTFDLKRALPAAPEQPRPVTGPEPESGGVQVTRLADEPGRPMALAGASAPAPTAVPPPAPIMTAPAPAASPAPTIAPRGGVEATASKASRELSVRSSPRPAATVAPATEPMMRAEASAPPVASPLAVRPSPAGRTVDEESRLALRGANPTPANSGPVPAQSPADVRLAWFRNVAPSPATGGEARFARSRAALADRATAELVVTGTAGVVGAPGTLLGSFGVEQRGDAVWIQDADGSRYGGNLVPGGVVPVVSGYATTNEGERGGAVGGMAPTQRPPYGTRSRDGDAARRSIQAADAASAAGAVAADATGAAAAAGAEGVSAYGLMGQRFRVVGTNRTLGQRVQMEGWLVWETNTAPVAQAGVGAGAAGASGPAGGAGSGNVYYMRFAGGGSTGRVVGVQGTLVWGATNRVTVNAVPGTP